MKSDVIAAKLAALGSATRLDIFRLLVRAGADGLAVGDVQQVLGLPGSTLTHHLQKLMHVGLVAQERHGRSLVCRADYEAMDAVLGYLTAECCSGVEVTAPSRRSRSARRRVRELA